MSVQSIPLNTELDTCLPIYIQEARNGSLENLASLINTRTTPLSENSVKEILDVASVYLSKDPPSVGDYSGLALRSGILSCLCLETLKCVVPYTPHVPSDMNGFAKVWPQALRWSQYLQSAINYVHGHATVASDNLISHYTLGITTFVLVSTRWNLLRMNHCQDTKLYDFVVAYWAMKGVPRNTSDSSAKALSQVQILSDGARIGIMDAMQSHFESASDIARLAIDRARLVLSEMDFVAMVYHYGVLTILLRYGKAHPVSEAILAEGTLPFAVASLSAILDAKGRSRTSEDWAIPSMMCLEIAMLSCQYPECGKLVADAFDCGLLEAFFKLGQVYDQLLDNVKPAITLLDENIPFFMHQKAVFMAFRHGFFKFSRKLDHRPFDIRSLQGEFREAWETFETLAVEHTVLRHMRARGIQKVLVYCGNIWCSIKGPRKTFMKCVGCNTALYCSQLCQKTSWKSHHRFECLEINKELSNYSNGPEHDESYLLYWFVELIKRNIRSTRESAARNYPGTAFDKLAIGVEKFVGRLEVYETRFTPLERKTTSAHERYFKNLALQRVEMGDKDATMLEICCNDGRSMPNKIYVVSMDKSSHNHRRRNWVMSGQKDKGDRGARLPTRSPFNLSGDIVNFVLLQQRDLNSNVWKPKFIRKCVDRYLKNLD